MSLEKKRRTSEDTHKLMGADVLGQIPLFDATGLIARYKFTLIWMDTDIVDLKWTTTQGLV
jgi:hypothetical protein